MFGRRPASDRRRSETPGDRETGPWCARGARRSNWRWWRGRTRAALARDLRPGPATWRRAASSDIASSADSNRRQRSCALRQRSSVDRSLRRLEVIVVRGGQAVQVVVVDVVVAGIVVRADEHRCRWESTRPLAASRSRTRGSFSMPARARAFGPPRPPPQAPQSWADSCGLFRLDEPWPMMTTSRANCPVRPMSCRTRCGDIDHLVDRIAQMSVFRAGRWLRCARSIAA